MNELIKKNILVVGATGVIGSSVSAFLKDIYCLTLTSSKKKDPSMNLFQLNLLNIARIDNFVNHAPKFETIFFFVGLAHSKGKSKDLDTFENVNYKTLKNLMNSLEKYNKVPQKIIYSSSISIYGEAINRNLYDENSIQKPMSPYAITKLKAEKFLKKKYYNKSWILRLAPVYSGGFSLNIDRRTKIKSFFYRVGNGNTKLSLCNIENINFVSKAITNDNVPSGTYIISDHSVYTYNDLLKHKKAKLIIRLPKIMVYFCYYLGKILKNRFMVENSVKLLSNNVFCSKKISKFITLPTNLNDIK